jgi:predicted Zn finger-like uncharacterized protein
MAEAQITRCPHCQTTFRIRSEQLVAAKGAVRCGSCLQVFKAANHFVSGEPKAVLKPTAAANATAPAPVKEDIVFDDSNDEVPEKFNDDPLEDFVIRQPDPDNNETFDNSLQLDDSIFSMQEKAKPSRYSLLDNKQDLEFDLDFDCDFDFKNEFDDDSFGSNKDNSDESWASNLMDNESKASHKTNTDDESWTDALLDVDGDWIEDIDMSFGKSNMPKEKDDFVSSLKEGPGNDQYHLGGHDEFEHETVDIELTIASSVNDLLDEPLNLASKSQKKAPIATAPSFLWFWLSGAIVMLFALVAQVGYFKFDSWSRHPQYRPAYAFTCELLSCKLPAVQDVSLMKTQHFMVRPHPKVKQALYIDTLLINSADYQQPFPDLNLIFTGLNEQIIASRHFKPREYLAGELAGSNSMPLNVPIHIAIEISNPGAEAVGYRIELVANH